MPSIVVGKFTFDFSRFFKRFSRNNFDTGNGGNFLLLLIFAGILINKT